MSAALRRLPPLATTGVGSLPFRRAREAAEHAVAAYELPFCPQLPRLSGDMVSEWLGADPGRCGWSPDRDRQMPAAWDAFGLALSARAPEHRIVKLQVTGPVTLATALERAAGRAGRGEPVVALATQIALWLSASAALQASWCRDELGLDVLLIADEPGLHHAALAADDARVWDPLRHAATAWGLHICGAVPWPVVAAAGPDVLSFDLLRFPVTAAAVPALAAIVQRGGRIAWGAVDAGAPADPPRVLAGIEQAWAALPARGTAGLLPASLISASCGTGGRSPQDERRVALALARVAALARGEPVPASTGTASTGTASTGTASTGTASTGTASTGTAAAVAAVQDDS